MGGWCPVSEAVGRTLRVGKPVGGPFWVGGDEFFSLGTKTYPALFLFGLHLYRPWGVSQPW